MKVYYKSTFKLIQEATLKANIEGRTIDRIEITVEEWSDLEQDPELVGFNDFFRKNTPYNRLFGIEIEIKK